LRFTGGAVPPLAKPRARCRRQGAFINEGVPRPAQSGRRRPEINHVARSWRLRRRHNSPRRSQFSAGCSGPEEVPPHGAATIKYGVRFHQAQPVGRKHPPAWAPRNADGRRGSGRGSFGKPGAATRRVRTCRSSRSVKQCVRHGIENIYHASFATRKSSRHCCKRARTSILLHPACLADQHLRVIGAMAASSRPPVTREYERRVGDVHETMRKLQSCVHAASALAADYACLDAQGTNARDLQYFFRTVRASADGSHSCRHQICGQIMCMAMSSA